MSRMQKYERIVEAEALPSVEQQNNLDEQPRARHLRLVPPETEAVDTTKRPTLMRRLIDAGEYGVDPYGNTRPSEQV